MEGDSRGRGHMYIYGWFHANAWQKSGFPVSSAGKEFTCNAGGPGLIPGFGLSPEEGMGYPLWYSWASLVAQMIKNPLAMQETWVPSLGQEDPLQKRMATSLVFLPGEFHGLRSLVGYSPWGSKELNTTVQLTLHFHYVDEYMFKVFWLLWRKLKALW